MNRKERKGKRLLCTSRMLTAMIVLSVFTAGIGIAPVSAQEASVTRNLPVFVALNEEFDVTLTQTNFFWGIGTVIETLPVGFEYVAGSYTGHGDVDWVPATRNLTLGFREDNAVTYSVTASSFEQTAEFLGTYATFVWIDGGVSEEGVVGGDPEVGVDGTPPYTDEHNPAKGATGVPVDTNIVVHVKDNFAVDPNSIEMGVDLVDVTSQLSLVPMGLGDWLVTYNPPGNLTYNHLYTITIDAADAAGHTMTQDLYTFRTEQAPVPDTTPPAQITNLATSNPTTSTIGLAWTAPGDDGNTGTAATYDIRYLAGTTPITDANWASATQCTGEPAPQAAGLGETFTVTGLGAGTDYCFAIKTADEVPNWSPISNSPCGTTTEVPDTTPPAAITDLATSNPTTSTIDLTWTAPGNDGTTGTAATYDIRYLAGTTPITDATWASATQCTGEPTPQGAGSSEAFTVIGLVADTDYYFAIKTADEVPNWSPVSNSPSGTTLVSPDTTPPYTSGHNPAKDATNVPIDTNIVVHVKDDGEGVDQTTIVMTVEGETVTPVITGSTADYTLTYDPADFGYEQVVDVTIDASDLAATPNVMPTDAYSFTTQTEIDTTPPYTSGHNPAKDATNVPIDTNIVVHVKDDGAGVDQTTIMMTVEGVDVTSSVSITGNTADYTLTYDPPADFGYEQVVDVTIDAADLNATPNVMPQDAYSFTTQAAPVYDVNLTVDDEAKTTTPGVNATYTLTVKNTGDTGDVFDIVIGDVTAGAIATLSEGVTPELAPDGTYDIFLNVSSAIENEMGYIVNVTATSQGDPTKSDEVMTKTIVTEWPRIGDMNGDGSVDFDDVILLARHIYFGDPVSDDPDVNGDGDVTFDDAILLARHIYFGDEIYP